MKDAADKIGSTSLVEELNGIESRMNSKDVPVMIPLVGEFSSGKTTLINSLTDSKALETATKPTTATIFEIHFGAPEIHAEILRENGVLDQVSDISSLKNDELSDATVVTVFDTSKQVSPFTILVDTPGISSPDPKHQQVLVDFLPQADALFLVIDINQQLTKSLSNFLKTVSSSGIELYVVLTKSDTKSKGDISAAKKYFSENCDFPIASLVAVSASTGDLSEMYDLLKELENRKSDILKKSINNRLKSISAQILSTIETLLQATSDNSTLETEIQGQKHKLQKIQRRIENFINNFSADVEDLTREYSRKFEDQVSSRLTSLINGKSQNYDAEAISAVNSIASAIVGDYRQKIMMLLADHSSHSNDADEVPLSVVTGIDLSDISVQGLSYNLDLNSLGHEYDGWIKSGVIAVGAIAAVGAVVATGGAAAGGAAAAGSAAAEGALTVGTAINAADTVTDIGSVIANRSMVKRMEKVVKYGQKGIEKYDTIDNFNNSGVGQSGVGKGMIDSLVGFIAEKTMSKPQRSRAIRMYIDDSLSPEFKSQLHNAETQVVQTAKAVLMQAAQSAVDELTSQLTKLQQEFKSNKSEAERHKTELRELQTKILTN